VGAGDLILHPLSFFFGNTRLSSGLTFAIFLPAAFKRNGLGFLIETREDEVQVPQQLVQKYSNLKVEIHVVVLRCVVACCGVLRCVAVCCGLLQSVAVTSAAAVSRAHVQ